MTTDAAPAPAVAPVVDPPVSQLDFLRLGVRFTVPQTRAGTASCPSNPDIRRWLSEQVTRRCLLLANGLDAACAVVETERRAKQLPFVKRETHSGTSYVLPTGVCETCGGEMASVVVRSGKTYLSTASRGGMCELCCLARRKNLLAEAAARTAIEEKKSA